MVSFLNIPSKKESSRTVLRLLCALLIVIAGLIDLLLWNGRGQVFWAYNCIMVGFVAMCCIITAGWGHKFTAKERWPRVGRQIMHWLGFLGVVYLLDSLIDMGTFMPKHAGLILLGLLGFCVYLAGLAVDLWLVLVGILLVLLAMSVVWVHQHLWLVMIPIGVAVVFLLLLAGMVHNKKSKDAQ